MDYAMIAWIVVLIAAVVIEIITLGLSSIWFAGGALVALIVAAFHGPLWLQIACFVVVSLLLLIFTRPIAVKYFNKDRVRTNAESIVGRQGIVKNEVNNLKGTGMVTVGGQEWSAQSAEENEVLTEGSVVEVVAISGVKLICTPVLGAAPVVEEKTEPQE
ncbi:MAG: NfeD family protein [Lachnospiraceae bacterium]|jgi:membrane protein implicated in regulation of membrane protease activity|nr:NfeD family protein [Lachnospiraceae bacterium]MBP5263244.1 NfeD family protein [Lachnospiraceae bacterium]MBP5670072.1 NfeD family protein [Lachnospiraceae bacterium]MBP5733211.1 NfeD family protein [Lachnospiraceae bacterium]MBR3468359.1 NfeD family protein [Lachnospiraceae bacterium]